MVSFGRPNFFIHGGRSVALNTGEILLIGQPRLFEPEFRQAIIDTRKYHTERTLRRLQSLSTNGINVCYDLLKEIDGYVNHLFTSNFVVERIIRLVNGGQLLALILPPVSVVDGMGDFKKLESISNGLSGISDVNGNIAADIASFQYLTSFADRIVYTLKLSPDFIANEKVKDTLKQGWTPAAVTAAAVVLANWAKNNHSSAWFSMDDVLIALGWASVGWVIFAAMKTLFKCLKVTEGAGSIKDLETAAEMMADTIVMCGDDNFIGLLARGASKLNRAGLKNSSGTGATSSGNAPSGSTSSIQSKADIDAQNKADIAARNEAKAEAAKTAPATTNTQSSNDDSAEEECTCVLDALTVTCSHGRSAKDGLLQIVAKGAAKADDITIAPEVSGSDCSSKLTIQTQGFGGSAPSENTGTEKLVRPTSAPSAGQLSTLGYWKATPSVATIEALACGKSSETIRVERYPLGESSISFNLTKIIQGITGGFDKMPFDNALFTKKGQPRQRRRPGEAKSEDFTLEGIKKRAVKGIDSKGAKDADWVIKAASGWKEDSNTNLAYCELAGIVEADPLLSFGTEILLYGIPIPRIVRKYCNIAAGFFLVIEGKISVAAKVVGKKYPAPKDKWEWDSISGEIAGALKFQLKAELIVLSPKAIQAVASGTTGASIKGEPANSFDSKINLKVETSIGGLKTKVVFKAAWGLVEYERAWQIFEPIKPRERNFKLMDWN